MATSTPKSIPATLPDNSILEGSSPVVFIGPNGAGKTRFGAAVAEKSHGTRIPALRSLSFASTISMQVAKQAASDVNNMINRYQSAYYIQADELNAMLSELKAEHMDEASRFRDAWIVDKTTVEVKATRLDALLRIWHQTFPGRRLDFSTYEPRTISSLTGGAPQSYNSHTMSDGERAAIYLIARVLRAPAGIIVVDEPEVHFHSLLARSFWDTLQAERADCRFVYVTHDLPFALSRRGAEIGIVRSKDAVQMVDRSAGIPPDIVEEILGAASLSLVAKRIVFTEGMAGASIDADFYGAWLQSPETAVVPVGSCRAVLDAVKFFQLKKVVSNVEPLGIVERDYLPDRYLDYLGQTAGLFVLPTHEVESLLCLREVAAAVARHQGRADIEFTSIYSTFECKVRSAFIGGRLHKHLMERIKADINGHLDGIMNSVALSPDVGTLKASLVSDFGERIGKVNVGKIFDEQKAYVDAMLAKPAAGFLKVLPGKDCLKFLTGELGVTEDVYVDLVCAALREPDGKEEPTFKRLKDDLVAALSPHLPPR
jgi:hypothetical protein